jgi:hypothetical protein
MSICRTLAALLLNPTGAIDMKLDLIPLCSSLFTHSVKDKVLVTDVTDLGRTFAFSQLYDDACDVGLALQNEKTSHVTTWYVSRDVHDAEGDLMHIELLPTYESVAANPAIVGYKMMILND